MNHCPCHKQGDKDGLSVTLDQGHCYCYTGPELSVTIKSTATLYKGGRQMLDWEMVLRFERRSLSGHLQSFFFLSEGETERESKRQKEMHSSSTPRESKDHFWLGGFGLTYCYKWAMPQVLRLPMIYIFLVPDFLYIKLSEGSFWWRGGESCHSELLVSNMAKRTWMGL